MTESVTLEIQRYRPEEEESRSWATFEVPLHRETSPVKALAGMEIAHDLT